MALSQALDFSPIGNIPNNIADMRQQKQNMEYNALQSQAAKVALQKSALELSETQKAIEKNNKVVSVDDLIGQYKTTSPEFYNSLIKQGTSLGYITPSKVGGQDVMTTTIGQAKEFKNLLEQDKTLQKEALGFKWKDINNQLNQVNEELANFKGNLNVDKKGAELLSRRKQLTQQSSQILSQYAGIESEMAAQAKQAEIKAQQEKEIAVQNVKEAGDIKLKEMEIEGKKTSGENKEQVTLYGPDGKTKRVSLNKGQDYTPPEGWSLKAPTKEGDEGKITESNWLTASDDLASLFGSRDAMGQFVITKELQGSYNLARKKFVELKNNDAEPLDAMNQAYDYVKGIEDNYKQYLEAATTQEQKAKVQKSFKTKYGYVPQ